MPWGDRTGPRGLGPRTGRGLGYCSGYSTPGYTKGPGMGMGWGRGGGLGWGRGYGRRGWGRVPYPEVPYPYPYPQPYPSTYPVPPVSPAEEEKHLNDVINNLKKEIEVLEDRLRQLKKRDKDQ